MMYPGKRYFISRQHNVSFHYTSPGNGVLLKLHVTSADIGVTFYKTLQIQARQNRKTNISHFCFSFITILYAGYR